MKLNEIKTKLSPSPGQLNWDNDELTTKELPPPHEAPARFERTEHSKQEVPRNFRSRTTFFSGFFSLFRKRKGERMARIKLPSSHSTCSRMRGTRHSCTGHAQLTPSDTVARCMLTRRAAAVAGEDAVCRIVDVVWKLLLYSRV
ncbi:hypothetical protein MTR67_014528 [Solanum verrucosum]|uniref:Uncharacterized protein n=1 Tax=Solanum verrucosum TaxID=315347 RepID=A0AAF0TN67_SOLVR|nr:hypothetical protein MTR67_014528 [Solanum verrucosum]